jgi:hypothetical protein
LTGLRENRCSECGNLFDPADPESFLADPPPGQCPWCGRKAEALFNPPIKLTRFKCLACGVRLRRLKFGSPTTAVGFVIGCNAFLAFGVDNPFLCFLFMFVGPFIAWVSINVICTGAIYGVEGQEGSE